MRPDCLHIVGTPPAFPYFYIGLIRSLIECSCSQLQMPTSRQFKAATRLQCVLRKLQSREHFLLWVKTSVLVFSEWPLSDGSAVFCLSMNRVIFSCFCLWSREVRETLWVQWHQNIRANRAMLLITPAHLGSNNRVFVRLCKSLYKLSPILKSKAVWMKRL